MPQPSASRATAAGPRSRAGVTREWQLTGTANNLLMAGSLIAVVPVLIVAMFAQRKVVEGLTLGAIR